ncbi:hypothetical protein LINPERHAP1_LOCUS8921, partial [Linum perenne]
LFLSPVYPNWNNGFHKIKKLIHRNGFVIVVLNFGVSVSEFYGVMSLVPCSPVRYSAIEDIFNRRHHFYRNFMEPNWTPLVRDPNRSKRNN